MRSKIFLFKVFAVFFVVLIALYILPKKAAILINNQAARYYKDGNISKAMQLYKRSILISPLVESRYNLACAYEEIGEVEKAVNEFEAILKSDPKHRLSRDALVDIYRRMNNFEKAEYYLKKFRTYDGEAINGNLDDLNYKKAVSLYNQGIDFLKAQDNPQAIQKMQQALQVYPRLFAAYQALGNIALSQNCFPEASAYYQKAVKLGSKNPEIFNNLGIVYMLKEEYPEAIKYLSQAHKLSPENIEIQYSLASTLRDNHNFQKALVLFEEIAVLVPDYPNIHNDMGACYDCIGKLDLAQAEYIKAKAAAQALLAQDKYDLPAQLCLAKAYFGLNQSQKAKDMLDMIIKQKPNYREAYYARWHVFSKMGDERLAKIDLQKAKQLLPDFSRNNIHLFDNVQLKEMVNEKEGLSAPLNGLKPITDFTADTIIIFNNGQKMEGKVKQEDQDTIAMELIVGDSIGCVTFSKKKIKSIKKSE